MSARPTRYPVPARRVRHDDEIKGSRFLTSLAPAATVAKAKEFVEAVRQEFPDATHNCWAYVVGPPGSLAETGSSDDGEPGGTAGRPMLATLLGSGVGDIVAVVTRYFGGVKLGRGGLVRAYTAGVKRALDILPRAERVEERTVQVGVDYTKVDAVRRAVDELDGRVLSQANGARAELTIAVAADIADALLQKLTDATGGDATIVGQVSYRPDKWKGNK